MLGPWQVQVMAVHVPRRTALQWESQWVSSDGAASPGDLLDDVVVTLDEMVRQADVFTEAETADGVSNFSVLPSNYSLPCGSKEEVFVAKPYYYHGDCFSVRLPSCLTELGVLEVVFDFEQKVDVFIHHDGYFLHPNSRFSP